MMSEEENNKEKNNDPQILLKNLFAKYSNHPYMLNRLNSHLNNLESILESEHKRHEEKVLRINELMCEQENFYKIFLSKHQYYHMPYNNVFYEYDGQTYKVVKEDHINYHLLSTITDEGKLTVWKHKTKQTLLKKIKERNLFKSIPETYTIQNVLSILSNVFCTKNEAKYFLTVIGDCILKKNNVETNIFFVNQELKKIIMTIDSINYFTTGNTIMNHFVSKYHDSHKLPSYRIMHANNESNVSFDFITEVVSKFGIDFLCVATHYSERYSNSDNYLLTKADANIREVCMFFYNNPISNIIESFVSQCLEKADDTHCLTWKNMHYIWKSYLTNMNVPNVLYSNNLKVMLKEKLPHNELPNGDILFSNVTSKLLPSIANFLSFWEKHIFLCEGEEDDAFDNEYEIDELLTLYRNSCLCLGGQIKDDEMVKIISHYFYPNVEVIDKKYVTNIKCNLWDKQSDIKEMLKHYKELHKEHKEIKDNLLSIDELYEAYKDYIHAKCVVEKNANPIVSKQFFEKFVSFYLMDYLKFDKFITSEWLQKDV
jgi:hypothetical protein